MSKSRANVPVKLRDDVPDFCKLMEGAGSKSETWLSETVFRLIFREMLLDWKDEKDYEVKFNVSLSSNDLLAKVYLKARFEIEAYRWISTGYEARERLTREGFDKLVGKTLKFSDRYSSCSAQTTPVIVNEKENRFAEDVEMNYRTKMSLNEFKSFYQKHQKLLQ